MSDNMPFLSYSRNDGTGMSRGRLPGESDIVSSVIVLHFTCSPSLFPSHYGMGEQLASKCGANPRRKPNHPDRLSVIVSG